MPVRVPVLSQDRMTNFRVGFGGFCHFRFVSFSSMRLFLIVLSSKQEQCGKILQTSVHSASSPQINSVMAMYTQTLHSYSAYPQSVMNYCLTSYTRMHNTCHTTFTRIYTPHSYLVILYTCKTCTYAHTHIHTHTHTHTTHTHIQKWHERYFILRSNKTLECHKSKRAADMLKSPRRIIDLRECISLEIGLEYKNLKHILSVGTFRRTFFLAAPSDPLMLQWAYVMEMVKNAQDGTFVHVSAVDLTTNMVQPLRERENQF